MANPSSQRGDEDLPGLKDSGHPVIVAKELTGKRALQQAGQARAEEKMPLMKGGV